MAQKKPKIDQQFIVNNSIKKKDVQLGNSDILKGKFEKPMPKKKKIFIIDTSVLLHDHESITSFSNNDVAIPITVLEELDKFKIGNDTKNFSAREVIRFIDKLSGQTDLREWISLGKGKGKFKVILGCQPTGVDASTPVG